MINYREYAMNPVDLKTVASLQHIVVPIVTECASAEAAARSPHDIYSNWVSCWKDNYNQLTDLIRETRKHPSLTQAQQHIVGNYLRRIANTMLNARQYAKDIRKNHKNTSVA